MTLKIINIVNHIPAYEAHRDRGRPQISWDLPDGNWAGIWGFEWQDKIGDHVLAISNDITYEVWQPDLRVDKIYAHKYESGLVHKLFPTKAKKYLHGFKFNKNLYSKSLIEELEKLSKGNEKIILHINAGYRYINLEILKRFHHKFPIVGQFYTNSKGLFNIPKTKDLFKLANAYKKRTELNNYYKKIKYIIPSVRENIELFEKRFNAVVFRRNTDNFGTDFSSWKRTKDKDSARRVLNLPLDKFIIYFSSRLVPVKQIDKLIKTLSEIHNDNFLCVIAGKGSNKYEKYLKKRVIGYELNNKVLFVGYVDYSKSKDYYLAADLVISTSKKEAGPTSPFEAAALGIPMLLTDTGIASEFYKDNDAGIILPTKDYQTWEEKLIEVIEGKEIKVPERENLEKFEDWNEISKYYFNVYKFIENANF